MSLNLEIVGGSRWLQGQGGNDHEDGDVALIEIVVLLADRKSNLAVDLEAVGVLLAHFNLLPDHFSACPISNVAVVDILDSVGDALLARGLAFMERGKSIEHLGPVLVAFFKLPSLQENLALSSPIKLRALNDFLVTGYLNHAIF